MRESEKLEIQKSQKQLHDRYGHNLLNILNGQMMYDYFNKHNLMEYGRFAPFNEALCDGSASGDIFSSEFIAARCTAHNVIPEQYKKITLEPLQDLFCSKFDCIVLWFGNDMFCQINFLTVLAYLEQISFNGKIFLNLLRENTMEIEQFKIEVQGYKKLYYEVLINRRLPKAVPLPVLYNGIRLYLEYLKEENDITLYINKHLSLSEDLLIKRLFRIFYEYGLGDTQYLEIINKCRNRCCN